MPVLNSTGIQALVLLAAFCAAAGPQHDAPVRGSYYGQHLPSVTPEPFAAETAVALGIARAPVFSRDGAEMFWARSIGKHKSSLMTSRLVDGTWSPPVALPFSSGEFFDHNPAISRDGLVIVFATNRPIPGKAATLLPGSDVPTSDLWISRRTAEGWSAPSPLAAAINTEADEDCPVLAGGTLYFSSSRPTPGGSAGSVYRADAKGGSFGDPERLPPPVSESGEMVSGVAPDGGYVLFYSMKRGDAGGLCVSFREPGGTWATPVRLAPLLGGLNAYAASVTHDGQWLFLSTFGSKGPGVYWVSAKVLETLRPRR